MFDDDYFWIILGVLAIIALPVMTIAAFFMALGLRKRIHMIESQLQDLIPGFIRTTVSERPRTTPRHAESRPAPGAILAPQDQMPSSDKASLAKTPHAKAPTATESKIPSVEPDVGLTQAYRDEGAALAEASGQEPPRPSLPPKPASREQSLEETLGTKWVVWVGGLALALGGIFLVRYSIEAGLMGPAARIFTGFAFSTGLLAGGEWLRRRWKVSMASSRRHAFDIPSILTAAGSVSLFATVFTAHALYGYIGHPAALLLLGLVGLGTMVAAALHGPWIAALGLLGAYAAPFLLTTGQRNFWSLAAYLAMVTLSSYGLARLRQWRWLAIGASVAACLWGAGFVANAEEDVTAVYLLVLTTLVIGILIVEPHRKQAFNRLDYLGTAALAALACLAFLFTQEALIYQHDVGYLVSEPSIMVAFLIAAAALATALAFDAMALAAVPAALLVIAIAFFWPHALEGTPPSPVYFYLEPPFIYHALQQTQFYIGVMALAAVALFGGTTYRLFRRPAAASPALPLAASGVIGPLFLLVFSYLHFTQFTKSIPFGLLGLGAGLLLAGTAHLFLTKESKDRGAGYGMAASIHAAGAASALSLALTMVLEGSTLTLAFALTALGTAWVANQRPLRILRYGAAAFSILVMLRFGGAWTIYGELFEIFPSWNEILWRYALPALALWLAGSLLRRQASDAPAAILDGSALVLGATSASLAIRLWIVGQDKAIDAPMYLMEAGLNVACLLAAAAAFARIAPTTSSLIYRIAAPVFTTVAIAAAILGPSLILNPLFSDESIEGGLVINALLLGYALPALLCVLLYRLWSGSQLAAHLERGESGKIFGTMAGAIAIFLGFVYLTLETHVMVLGNESALYFDVPSESYAISAVWLIYGLALLAGGIALRSQRVRLASAIIFLIATIKVFLFDMQDLEGVWRALSFIGLGATLIGIGLFYQRFLFRYADLKPEENPTHP